MTIARREPYSLRAIRPTNTRHAHPASTKGVRIMVRKMQHGISGTRYVPRELFETNEYRHIKSLAGKLKDLIGEELCAEPFDQKDGFITVPTGPGLGIEVDEKALERWLRR